MNGKDITIEINFLEKKLLIKNTNKIRLEDLIKQSAKTFNIDKDKIKNIIFIYIDEVGDINKIYEIEHILNIAKEVSPEKYKSIIYLKISKYESYNLSIEEEDEESILKKRKENENKINKIKEEKDKKIKELEEIIKKMNNKHSEELIKKKSEKTSTGNNKSVSNGKETLKENKNKKEKNKIDISKIELLLNKNNIFSSTIQEMKNEIILEIKELKNEIKNKNNDRLEYLKSNISNLNSNVKENMHKLSIIKKDISLVNDAINIIEKKRKEKKDNNKNKNKDNNIKKNIINNAKDLFNVDNMPLKNINKSYYRCSNCNNCFISQECSNEGQKFEGHFLMLVEFPKKNNNDDNDNDNDNKINENINEKNNKNINNDNENEIKNNNNINEEKKEEFKIIKGEDNKENIENENNVGIENFLNELFFNDDKKSLKVKPFDDDDLNNIKEYYLSKNNIDINIIENYQVKYFEDVKQKISTSTENHKKIIKNKIKKIKKLLKDIKKNENK